MIEAITIINTDRILFEQKVYVGLQFFFATFTQKYPKFTTLVDIAFQQGKLKKNKKNTRNKLVFNQN